jgi:hypothetical protein
MDTILTKLSPHKDTHRIWIEDSYGRLQKNGFSPNTPFSVQPRAGRGLILKTENQPTTTSVSKRQNKPLLSLERKTLARSLDGDLLRARISIGQIILVPRVLCFSIQKPHQNIACISGTQLQIGGAPPKELKTPKPQRNPEPIAYLEAEITADNIVYATEFMLNNLPKEIKLSGPEAILATKWLLSLGYFQTSENSLSR